MRRRSEKELYRLTVFTKVNKTVLYMIFSNREIIAKNFAEMEQLKRNREAREAAREDMEMITRDQERRQCDWNRTEDVFHLKQAKLRSSLRIKEGRAKSIDYLAR